MKLVRYQSNLGSKIRLFSLRRFLKNSQACCLFLHHLIENFKLLDIIPFLTIRYAVSSSETDGQIKFLLVTQFIKTNLKSISNNGYLFSFKKILFFKRKFLLKEIQLVGNIVGQTLFENFFFFIKNLHFLFFFKITGLSKKKSSLGFLLK